MWVFLSDGFFSIVAPSPRDPAVQALPVGEREEAVKHCLLVRARHEGDIERVFGNVAVRKSPHRDYLFRSLIGRGDVAVVMARELAGVTYENFKNSIPDRPYHDACSRVWVIMDSYQSQQAAAASRKAAPASPRYVRRG